MAVLTHMVGRLGPLAIQDPHIQSVLYALLQKGLEGSPAEQEVLVEDALKLLNATLSASSSLAEPLQVWSSLFVMQQHLCRFGSGFAAAELGNLGSHVTNGVQMFHNLLNLLWLILTY